MEFNDKIIDFSTPVVMGIINIAPDSFYDGGKYSTEEEWIDHTGQMIKDGAEIIDIGAVSTRPNALLIDEQEEINRLLPVLKVIRANYPDTIISVDTYRSIVARQVIKQGANMINDISGGRFDHNMFDVIAQTGVPYVMMHIQGTPQNMQINPVYENIVEDIKSFFHRQIDKLNKLGVRNIIIDPGFGFGKSLDHNYELLFKLKSFHTFGLPLMAGISRKSMINKVLGTSPTDALPGTIVLNTIALLNGVNLLRVHDVKEAMDAVRLVAKYKTVISDE